MALSGFYRVLPVQNESKTRKVKKVMCLYSKYVEFVGVLLGDSGKLRVYLNYVMCAKNGSLLLP